MKSAHILTPLIAFALATFPAVGLHAQQQDDHPQQQMDQQQMNQQQMNHQQRDQGGQNYQQGNYQQSNQWDTPPSQLQETGRRGYQDGVNAARNDMGSNHQMDARRSQMYRHPPVRRHDRNDYRQGFTQGYQMSMQHQRDGNGPQRVRHDDDDHHGSPQ